MTGRLAHIADTLESGSLPSGHVQVLSEWASNLYRALGVDKGHQRQVRCHKRPLFITYVARIRFSFLHASMLHSHFLNVHNRL